MIKKIRDIVNKAKILSEKLECDGSTRVINYLLKKDNIDHIVYVGSVSFNGKILPLHYWIVCGDYIIDNKIRMYFGEDLPEGVFKKSPATYKGDPAPMDTSKTIFDILTFDHK